MALEPKYEEQRDIRISVAARELPALVEKHLGSGYTVAETPAPKQDLRVCGPQPRGDFKIKAKGLLGKTVAEFYATGAHRVLSGDEKAVEKVFRYLDLLINIECIRSNLCKVEYMNLRPVTIQSEEPTDNSFLSTLKLALNNEIAQAEAELSGAPQETISKLKAEHDALAKKLEGFPEYRSDDWKRGLIPC